MLGVEASLILLPAGPRLSDVRPILLGGAQAFFEADAVPIEEAPHRTNASLLPVLLQQSALDLVQRQIGFPTNQVQQPTFVPLQRRAAAAAQRLGRHAARLPPALHPTDRRRIADLKLARRGSRRFSPLDKPNHTNSQNRSNTPPLGLLYPEDH